MTCHILNGSLAVLRFGNVAGEIINGIGLVKGTFLFCAGIDHRPPFLGEQIGDAPAYAPAGAGHERCFHGLYASLSRPTQPAGVPARSRAAHPPQVTQTFLGSIMPFSFKS